MSQVSLQLYRRRTCPNGWEHLAQSSPSMVSVHWMALEGRVRLRMLPLKRRTLSWLGVRILGSQSFRGELSVTGMNLLSGTTWKGAKLRIGEAKPDFRERYGSSHSS